VTIPDTPHYHTLPNGQKLAFYTLVPQDDKPTILFLSGFASHCRASKASALYDWCQRQGRGLILFDYRGHGQSGGELINCVLSDWLADAQTMLEQHTEGKVIVVGSSMGGWLGLLLARQYPRRIHALVGIATAADFTERVLWRGFSDRQKQDLQKQGVLYLPNCLPDAAPWPVTHRLIEDGRQHCLLDSPLHLDIPVRLLHGMQDADIPWRTSLVLMETLAGQDVHLHLLKDGDHRLSRPQDIAVLLDTVSRLS
jgi:pimeloyl-ACP methyl ester carboxylesterase